MEIIYCIIDNNGDVLQKGKPSHRESQSGKRLNNTNFCFFYSSPPGYEEIDNYITESFAEAKKLAERHGGRVETFIINP